ncbi:CocE/NonD family hydrolase [Rubrobacter indicoceani]|uniref:CocE/NonD family hydrolase n=1 Tax=Rubrobacter indicoceani TaxID=2051957 RepID=UPI000E5B51FE|nr:CocE/NonD family hydrolase [Rubrobacter indicoceani]
MTHAREVTVRFDVPATMRDGTTLLANVYRPAGDGAYPVLLTRLPYGKDNPRDTAYFDPAKAARRGYIVVVQDVRGRFASEGEFESFPQESRDGYDSVEWAARLPGSNGSVGMWGLSYYGKTQWHAATEAPPSLGAIAPGQTWGNHLNGASLRGGAQELGLVHLWAQGSIAPDLLSRKYADEPEKLREKMLEVVGIIDTLSAGGGFDVLPYSQLPDPEGLEPMLFLGRGADDGFWSSVNLDELYANVKVPVLHIGGWYDCFIGETLRQYAAIQRLCLERRMPPPRLVVGPWTHANFGSLHGDLDFGVAASGAAVDLRETLCDLQLRFFDETLKGEKAVSPEPPVKIFFMSENRWRTFESWPPQDSRRTDWYLGAEGTLTREPPPAGAPGYEYDPLHPVPTLGGQTLLAPAYGSGPVDQSPIEARPDVLVFTSGPLAQEITLCGPVSATLFASSSAPDTDFVVRLTDVYPDGRSIVLTDGVVRASARDSYPQPDEVSPAEPSPIKPGCIYRYPVDLWQTAATLAPGHRLRVHVTSSSFPRWDRNPNTGGSGHTSAETRKAHQTVHLGGDHPSRISVTIR